MLDALNSHGGMASRIAQFLLNRRTGAYSSDAFRMLSLSLTLLGGGAMLLLLLRPLRWQAALALVGLVSVLQYGGYIAVGDRFLLSGSETPGQGIYTLDEIASPTLASLDLPEEDAFKRIDYGPKLRNYGLLRGTSSLTSFMSLRTSTVGRFVSMAGFGYDESTTVKPPDGSATSA